MSNETKPEAAAVAELALQIGKVQQVQGHKAFIVTASGEVKYLEKEEPPKLHHITQRPTFRDAVSFIAYVQRFQDARLQLFADERAGTIVAVFDYHEPISAPNPLRPERGAHIATLKAEASPEWLVFMANNKKHKDQLEFAEFLEDNQKFITRPTGAEMLEMSLTFQATKGANFTSAKRLDNGQVQFNYTENIEEKVGAKGDATLPRNFDTNLRPFIGCEPYLVPARLKFRIGSGDLALWYELDRPEETQRLAFEAIQKRVADEVKVTPYLGAP